MPQKIQRHAYLACLLRFEQSLPCCPCSEYERDVRPTASGKFNEQEPRTKWPNTQHILTKTIF